MSGLDPAVAARVRAVRMLVLDVDGVLTDGTLWFGESSEEIKGFNIQDGHGIRMLADAGIRPAIITGRRSKAVQRRAANLRIDLVIEGAEDKRVAFLDLCARVGIAPEACAAIGDDVVDLPILRRCGFAAAVPEAPELVRTHVHHVTRAGGGRGAVRELCELILREQGLLDRALARYLE